MGSIHTGEGRDYYRCCTGHNMYHDCTNGVYVRERNLEEAALLQISQAVAGAEYQPQAKPAPAVNKQAIRRKLDRLKDLYIDGDIGIEKYRQMRDELTARLAVDEPRQAPAKLLGDNLTAEYHALDRPGQKAFWRRIVDRIEVSGDGVVDVFLDPHV